MSVIIRLQGLPWTASAMNIRHFFNGLSIPAGGVHIIGGEGGDAFIAFSSDDDARMAMKKNMCPLNGTPVQLFLSSKAEMQSVIDAARSGSTSTGGSALPVNAGVQGGTTDQRLQQFPNMYPLENPNSSNVGHQNSGFSTDLASQWQNFQMYSGRQDGHGGSHFNMPNQRASAGENLFPGMQSGDNQLNQFSNMQQPTKLTSEPSASFSDAKQLPTNILNTLGLVSFSQQSAAELQVQMADKKSIFNDSHLAPSTLASKPNENIALLQNILNKGQGNYTDVMAAGQSRNFSALPSRMGPGISNEKSSVEATTKPQILADKFMAQFSEEMKPGYGKDDRTKEMAQWSHMQQDLSFGSGQKSFEQDGKNENSLLINRDKMVGLEKRPFEPFPPSSDRMIRGPIAGSEIPLDKGIPGMAAQETPFTGRLGGRFSNEQEQGGRFVMNRFQERSNRFNESLRPNADDSMPSTRYPPDEETEPVGTDPKPGRFPHVRLPTDDRNFISDDRKGRGPEAMHEVDKKFRGFDNQLGPDDRRFQTGLEGRFPSDGARFPPDNRVGSQQNQESFSGRHSSGDVKQREREEDGHRTAFDRGSHPEERFMFEGRRNNTDVNEGRFILPDSKVGPEKGFHGDDDREYRGTYPRVGDHREHRERPSRWEPIKGDGEKNFPKPTGQRAPLLESPEMFGGRHDRPPVNIAPEDVPMDMDQRTGRGAEDGRSFDERRMGFVGRGGPGFEGRPGPGFEGRPGPGFDGRPGFEGRPGPGFEGRPGPGFEGRPGPGFDGRPGPGFEGRPLPGFEGRPGPGFEGRPGPGFEGRPGPGFEGRPGPGFEGRPGPGFEGRPGPGFEGRPGPGFEGRPGPSFEGRPGPGFDGRPGPGFDGRPGPGFEGRPGPGFDGWPGYEGPKEGFRGPGMEGMRGRGFDAARGRGFEGRGRGMEGKIGLGMEPPRPLLSDENRFEYGHGPGRPGPNMNDEEFGFGDFDSRFQGPPGRGGMYERRGRGDPFMRGRPGMMGRGRGIDYDRRFEDSEAHMDSDARKPDVPPMRSAPGGKVDLANKPGSGKGLLGDAPPPQPKDDNDLKSATDKKDDGSRRDYDYRSRRSNDRRSSDRRDRDDRRFDDRDRSRYRYERDRRRSRSRSRDRESRRSRDRSASSRDHESRSSPRRLDNRSKCILMKNLPNSISYKDVRRFLQPLEVPFDGLKLINDDNGQRTGEVYVRFRRSDDAIRAVRKNNDKLNGQSINILSCTEADFLKAVDSFVGKSNLPSNAAEKTLAAKVDDSDKIRYIVQLQNLPKNITKQDLIQFFKNLIIDNNGEAAFIEYDSSGVSTGNAFVEFKSDYDYKKALTQNGTILGTSTVGVIPGKKEDIDNMKNKKQDFPQKAGVYSSNGNQPSQPQTRLQGSNPKLTSPKTPTTAQPNQHSALVPEVTSPQVADTVCVHIQGLPLLATTQDIREFFSDCQIAMRGINIAHDGKGKPLGEGFVEFKFKSDFEKGIKKDKTSFGRHIVAVKPIAKKDMLDRLENARQRGLSPQKITTQTNDDQKKAVEQGVQQGDKNTSQMPLNVSQVSGTAPPTNTTVAAIGNKPLPQGVTVTAGGSKAIPPGVLNKNLFYVRCQNFPPDISIQEILHFFQGFCPISDSIRLHYSNEGKPTGNAVVGFGSADEAQRALHCLNSKPCRQNLVTLHPA